MPLRVCSEETSAATIVNSVSFCNRALALHYSSLGSSSIELRVGTSRQMMSTVLAPFV